ncbi:unnamed protein product [Polarella glacialis]|uniref:Bulb-type lectin domain-containing protein n=1 Tax=Polarella glacialis TaxID=89957 RepID=A0A813KBX0_POLGL|nr:unnamed protein product [Polarella glacialis]
MFRKAQNLECVDVISIFSPTTVYYCKDGALVFCGKKSDTTCVDFQAPDPCGIAPTTTATATTTLAPITTTTTATHHKGGVCNPKKRSPARMRSCAAECGRQGSTNMWACCESVDEGNVCQGLKAPDRLELGACLQARGGGDEGNSLQSDGGGWELRMQGDGNLAVYGNGGVVGDTEIKWASGSSGGNPLVCMQSDGNLVVYTACPANFQKCKGFYPLCGHGKGNYSVMQPDGNLVLYNKKGDGRTAVWATNDLNWEPGQQGR